MKVSDIMTSEGLATATLDTTLTEIATRMRDENVGAIPIVDEEDKLAGIITDRDIVVRGIAEGEDPNECTAEDIISEQLHTIHPHADIEEAAELMARHQIRRLPVVQDAVIIGMISLGDIAVKSEEDEAAGALEDISEGVRARSGSGTGEIDSEVTVIAGEEAEDLASEGKNSGRQLGGSRSSTSLAGRLRNWSRSQQTIVHETQELEGEDFQREDESEEIELQDTSGENTSEVLGSTLMEGRERSNQQESTQTRVMAERERNAGKAETRAVANAKSSGKTAAAKTSGLKTSAKAGNNRRTEEVKKPSKITTMRATGKTNARSKSKRKAS